MSIQIAAKIDKECVNVYQKIDKKLMGGAVLKINVSQHPANGSEILEVVLEKSLPTSCSLKEIRTSLSDENCRFLIYDNQIQNKVVLIIWFPCRATDTMEMIYRRALSDWLILYQE